MTPLDLDSLRLKKPLPPGRAKAKSTAAPRVGKGQLFLKGPISWPWLLAAMRIRLRGALPVALFIWRQSGLKRSGRVDVNLSAVPLPRTTTLRGLAALEQAGLVSVIRHAGRMPRVTILEVTDD